MHFYRGSCRAVARCSSKPLSDEEVCAVMHVREPMDVLACEHVRLLMEVLEHGNGFLWDLVASGSTWLRTAVSSLAVVVEGAGCKWQLQGNNNEILEALSCRAKQKHALLRGS